MIGPGSHVTQTTVRRVASDIALGLKNLFLPAFCQECGVRILTQENLYFCEKCWATIEPVREPKCPRCGRPHSRRVGFDPVGNYVCSECSAQKLWVGNTYAAGLYSGVLRDAVHLLKYGRKRLMAGPLGALLLDHVFAGIDIQSYDGLVPVPLHRSRLKERGYNQVELVSEWLCRRLSQANLLPVLRRVKDTPSFSMLGARERRSQIKNAFQLVPGADVRKQRFLLIDDVVTTGATSNECARVLRRAGAETVDVVAVAVAGRLQ